jgi:hypothetical protein
MFLLAAYGKIPPSFSGFVSMLCRHTQRTIQNFAEGALKKNQIHVQNMRFKTIFTA